MDSSQISQVIENAVEMNFTQAIIYLINTLEGKNGICFDCLDELLALYDYSPHLLTVQKFNEQCDICNLLCNFAKEQEAL
jgi:hypothetical protein